MLKPLLLLLSLLLCPAAWGSPHHAKHHAKQAPASVTSSPAQVDGIVSAAVDNLWAQTNRYWHVGDYPRIVALDRIITQADPHFIDCYNTGAWLLWSMGRNGDAEAFYRQAVQNNPRDPAAYRDFGFFYFHTLRNYPAALRLFQQSTALPDADANDWKMLAHSYEKAGDLPHAIAVWRHIQARWPDAPAVQSNLNRALAAQAAAAVPAPALKAPAP